MKTKQKTVKADKATAQGIVPKLRFPEFRDEGEWEEKPLGKMYSFKVTNSFSRDKLNYEKGLVKNIHYGDIHTKFSTLFDIRKEMVPFINSSEAIGKIKSDSYCIEGDMVFADASEDLNDVGKSIEIVNLNNEKILSGLHTLLARQKKTELVIGFGGYLFKSNDIRTGIKKEAQGAKVLGVSAGRLSNINIYFPTDKKEQQKIADCLSSIDELITTQAQKLDTLKTHKKGLMQQLFPAEDETFPKLRFPEFQDAGEWEEKSLGQVVKFLDGQRKPIKESDRASMQGQYPYYGASGIIDYINDFIFDETLILLGEDGENIVSRNLPLVFKISGKCWVNNHAHVLKPNKPHHLDFLVQYLESLSYIKYNSGGAQPKLNQAVCKTIPLLLPSPPEQQKIADCLTTIDDLITAQAQKLDTLKAHKKGLMQQLFPSTDEVTE